MKTITGFSPPINNPFNNPWVYCIFIALVLLSSCKKPEEPPTQIKVLRPVKTIVAESSEVARNRKFSGVTKSAQESRLSFNVSGTIINLPVSVGDKLEKGQLIAELDPSFYELQLQQTEASLLQTQASLRNAQANYDRIKGLYADSNASKNDLDSARSNADSAKAQVRAAQKSMELVRLNLGYTKLYAETSCTVASVNVEVNENVTLGTTVVNVACGSDVNVEVSVPETIIGLIDPGMKAQIELNALDEKTYSGTVKEVGYVAQSGATFPVTVSVEEKGNPLRSGLAADVIFDLPVKAAGVLVLPSSVVAEDKDGVFIYIVEDGKAGSKEAIVHRRTVKVGNLITDGIEILEGINKGERVVSAGVRSVRDGMTVRRDW